LRNTLAKMVKTHRQGAAMPFAPAFEDHVRQLSEAAIREDHERARVRKQTQTK
jgi:hypothetical protein